MAELESPPYELVLEPSRGGFRFSWREFLEYRDLLRLLVERDFISRYKQTVLGPVWFIFQPMLTTAVFALVFSHIAGISTGTVPAPIFYWSGLLAWNYFAQNIAIGGNTFTNNAGLFSKVYFPRVIVPLAVVIGNLGTLAIQSVAFAGLVAIYALQGAATNLHPDWHLLLLPLVVAQLAVLSLAFALIFSALTAKYRDLSHLNQYLVQLWMFATPIIYPTTQIPAKWHWVMLANPAAVPVEMFRGFLLGQTNLQAGEIVFSVILTLLLFLIGMVLFQRVARTVVDTA